MSATDVKCTVTVTNVKCDSVTDGYQCDRDSKIYQSVNSKGYMLVLDVTVTNKYASDRCDSDIYYN